MQWINVNAIITGAIFSHTIEIILPLAFVLNLLIIEHSPRLRFRPYK